MSENATTPTNGAAQLSDDEINTLADAARALSPGMRFVGRPLNFGWENGAWYWKPDRDHEEKVGATEAFAIDLRSAGEAWKRWGRMDNGKVEIVDQIGGRYVDGWRNPPRHAMPEADEDLPASDDPSKDVFVARPKTAKRRPIADLERGIQLSGRHGGIPRHRREGLAGPHRMHAGRSA